MKKYTVLLNKYNFRPLSWPIIFNKNKFKVRGKFSENCFYNIQSSQTQINKLTGFSPVINHHQCSFRIGWRYCHKKSKIELLTYTYDQNIRSYLSIGYVELNKEFEINYIVKNKSVIVNFREKIHIINFSRKMATLFKKRLDLYFGGKTPAPHQMNIFLSIT